MERYFAPQLLAGLISLCFLPVFSLCADEPIPIRPDAYLHKDFLEEQLEFRLLAVEDYKRLTKDEGRAKQAGIDFLHEYTRRAAHKDDEISPEELAVMAHDANLAGSKDPLVMLYAARTALMVGQTPQGLAMLKQLSGVWDKNEYPKLYSQFCEQWQYVNSEAMDRGRDLRFAPPTLINAIVANFQEPVAKEVHLRCKWNLLGFVIQQLNTKDLDRLKNASEAAEGVDPWFTHMVAGTADLRRSWNHFPANYEEANANHKKRLVSEMTPAGEHFTAAWKLHPKFPEPAAEMIRVAMVGADDHTPRYWFDQTVAVELDYADAYAYLFDALRPHWGGSHSKIWKFGLECRDTSRFDTSLPIKMIQGVNLIDRDLLGSGEAWRRTGVYDACLRLFAGYEKQYANQEDLASLKNLNYYRSIHAAVAVRAEQHEHARKIFEKVGDEFSLRGYRVVRKSQQLHMDKARVFALTSEAGPRLLELEKKLNEKSIKDVEQVEQFLKELEALTSKHGNDGTALPFFVHLRDRLEAEKEQFDDSWRELLFDPQNPRWSTYRYSDRWGENFIVENPRSLIMAQTEPDNILKLMYEGIFPAPYMLEVDIELLNEGPTRNAKLAPCILILKKGQLLDSGRTFRNRYRVFYIDSVKGRVGTWDYPGQSMGRDLDLNEKANRLRVKVWPGYFDYYVNGARLMQLKMEDFEPQPEYIIAIIPHDKHLNKVRFSNFRAKPLAYGPPPEDGASPEQEILYYTKVIQADPEEGYAYSKRGGALFALKKYQESLEDYLAATKHGVGVERFFAEGRIARIYVTQKKYEEALPHFRESVRLAPAKHKNLFRNNFAWFLSTCPDEKCRNGEEAMKIALAMQAEKNLAPYMEGTIGAVYAENGNFEEAIAWTKKALTRMPANEKATTQESLDLYLQNKPYRELPN